MSTVTKAIYLFFRQLQEIHWGYLAFGAIALLIAQVVDFVCEPKMTTPEQRDRRNRFVRIAAAAAAIWWVGFIIDVTILQDKSGSTAVYLIPFDPASWLSEREPFGFHERRLFNALLNVLLFVPLGFFLRGARLSRRPGVVCIMICLVAAIGIEAAQYLLASGEVLSDEVIMRCIGGFLGVKLCSSFCGDKGRRACR